MTWTKPTASSTARGYGQPHRNERKRWIPIIATGAINCWRCNKIIQPWMEWELGHDDWDRSVTRGPEHKQCNRKAAAKKARRMKVMRTRKQLSIMDDSRVWNAQA